MTVNTEILLMLVPLILILLVIFVTYRIYVKQKQRPEADSQQRGFISNLAYHKFYIDEIYNGLFVKPISRFSNFLNEVVELKVINGIIRRTGNFVVWSGKNIRYVQTGNVGFYLFATVLSIILILLINLFY